MDDSERRNRATHAYCTSDEYEDAVGPIAIVCHVAGQVEGETYAKERLVAWLRQRADWYDDHTSDLDSLVERDRYQSRAVAAHEFADAIERGDIEVTK